MCACRYAKTVSIDIFAGDYMHRGMPLHMKFTVWGNQCFGFLEAVNVFTMEIDLWNNE